MFSLGFAYEIKTKLGEKGLQSGGGGAKDMCCCLSSYFASISLLKKFHDPRTIPPVWVVAVVLKVTLVLALVQN